MAIGSWVLVLALCALIFWLADKPTLWIVVGAMFMLASAYGCMMSIIQFEIVAALGFTILTTFIAIVTSFLIELTSS